MNIKTTFNYLLLILSFFFTFTAQADNSKELALLGKKFWVAFECSSIASVSGESKEQERLLLYGYEKGKLFIESLKNNKIKKEDISKSVPSIVMLTLQGPSTDFILGRIFEVSLEYSLKDIHKTDGKYNSEEIQKFKAGTKYIEKNCELIGQQN